MKKANFSVLLINLGTPEAPTPKAVRKYLRQFLSDTRVIEVPKPIWFFILNLFILPFRPKRTAELYSHIWSKERGSPLLYNMEDIAKKLPEFLAAHLNREIPVYFASTYGSPSIDEVLTQIDTYNILALPMYPQNSGPTIGAAFDALASALKKYRNVPNIRWVSGYNEHPLYIQALSNSIKKFLETNKDIEKLIFSYHGMPVKNIVNGDNYYDFCSATTKKVVENLNLSRDFYAQTFQSRFGPAQWLEPYTDHYLKDLAKSGVKCVGILSPAFAVDCLETLEELEITNRRWFIEAGGEDLRYIPCLNACNDQLQLITNLVQENTQSWINKIRDY